MKFNQIFLLPILIIVFLTSCVEKKFVRSEWINDDPTCYKQRKAMVADLLKSDIILNKHFLEITQLLGNPNGIDSTLSGKIQMINYTVNISYGFDIDPKYFSFLLIEIDTLTNKSINAKIENTNDRRTFLEKILTE